MASSGTCPNDQIRLLIVEDVPQVAQYVREPAQQPVAIKLLDILTKDGRAVSARSTQLRPDIVLIDSLLQGRMKGPQVVEQLDGRTSAPPIIVLTVPQNPVEVDAAKGVHRVLSMPFSGFDLVNMLTGTVARGSTSTPRRRAAPAI